MAREAEKRRKGRKTGVNRRRTRVNVLRREKGREREKERELRDTWGLGKSAIRLPTVTRCVCVSTLAEKEKKGKRRDPHNRVAGNYIHGYYRR